MDLILNLYEFEIFEMCYFVIVEYYKCSNTVLDIQYVSHVARDSNSIDQF